MAVTLACSGEPRASESDEPTGVTLLATLDAPSGGGAPLVRYLQATRPGEAPTGESVISADGISVNKGATNYFQFVAGLVIYAGVSCAIWCGTLG